MAYQEDVKIDAYKLDQEWMRQPVLFAHYSEQLAQKQYERDRAKDRLEIVRAELDRDIRQNPAAFGLDKVTEGSIASAIQTHERHKEAQEVYTQALHDVRVVEAARESIRTKGDALKNLTQLWLSNYYTDGMGEPPKPIQEKMDKMGQEAQRAALGDNQRLAQTKQ